MLSSDDNTGPSSFIVVESEDAVAQLVSLKLKMLFPGCSIDIATSADAAVEAIEATAFDICFLDLFLGGQSGIEVLKRFKHEFCPTAFIVMTSQSRRELAAEAMHGGAYDYLVKGHYDDFELEKCVAYAIYRKQRELEIYNLATRDPLTGLANRALFKDRLEGAVNRANRERDKAALLYIDIDGFKKVNDTRGHTVGDQLLIMIADRLRARVRQTDTVARLGGDEFAVLVEKPRDRATAVKIAQEIWTNLCEDYLIGETALNVGASIGLAVYPDDVHDLESTVDVADARMYRIKRAGGGVLSE